MKKKYEKESNRLEEGTNWFTYHQNDGTIKMFILSNIHNLKKKCRCVKKK